MKKRKHKDKEGKSIEVIIDELGFNEPDPIIEEGSTVDALGNLTQWVDKSGVEHWCVYDDHGERQFYENSLGDWWTRQENDVLRFEKGKLILNGVELTKK